MVTFIRTVQIAASYNFSAARVDFYYVNVPFWGMPSSISFRISLFSDSKIQIFYDKVCLNYDGK